MNPRAIDLGIIVSVVLSVVFGVIVILDDGRDYGWFEIAGWTGITVALASAAARSLDNLLSD